MYLTLVAHSSRGRAGKIVPGDSKCGRSKRRCTEQYDEHDVEWVKNGMAAFIFRANKEVWAAVVWEIDLQTFLKAA